MGELNKVDFEASEELDKLIDPAFELSMAGLASWVLYNAPGEIASAPGIAEKASLAMVSVVAAAGGAVMAKVGVEDVWGLIRSRKNEAPTSDSE